jgi:predicted  nucleic acid-binding Zn-ribbon protein
MLFGSRTDPTSERYDALMIKLGDLKQQVAELSGDRAGHQRAQTLEEELAKLRRDLTDKQIEFDREQEKWDREKREVEHMVGLQQKRSEFDAEAASREATLSVREENLTAQQQRFDEHVKFIEKRFDQQFKSLETLTGQILERMPTTQQLITVGASKNGEEN